MMVDDIHIVDTLIEAADHDCVGGTYEFVLTPDRVAALSAGKIIIGSIRDCEFAIMLRYPKE